MSYTVLLRFRDILADTITKHQEIIDQRGYVWWGWWKKAAESPQDDPSEPDRALVFRRLKERVVTTPVEIGLFDRSESRFFVATVTEIRYEPAEEPIPTPEPLITPEYYRDRELPAWFKLTRIEPVNEEAFSSKFLATPVGNATLFPIFIRQERRITGISPHVTDVIVASGNAIVHLSDLHFGNFAFPQQAGPGQTPLEDIIQNDVERIGIRVGILVVSGDITNKANDAALFSLGLPFIRTIQIRLGLEPEHVVIVPGNHDIPLANYDPVAYAHETRFNQFLESFYGARSQVMQVRRYLLPGRRHLEILTMNSCRLRKPEYSQFGYVQWSLYEPILSALTSPGESPIRIAVLHHHLVSAIREEPLDPEYPEAAVSVTLDAGAVIEGLQRYGFGLALHGHQHVPGVTRVGRGRLKEDSPSLAGLEEGLHLVASGSAGCKRLHPEMPYNTFNILELQDKRVRLRVRQFNAASAPRDYIRQDLSLLTLRS